MVVAGNAVFPAGSPGAVPGQDGDIPCLPNLCRSPIEEAGSMSNDMRPDIEAAWSQVSNNFGKKRDINKLPEYLNEGETVLAITGGIVARKNGLLVATNRRALFVAEGVVNQADRSSARDAGGPIAVLARAARMTSAIPASTATCCPRGTSSSTPRTITMIPTGQAATAFTAGNHCAITSFTAGTRAQGPRRSPSSASRDGSAWPELVPPRTPGGRRAPRRPPKTSPSCPSPKRSAPRTG